MDVAGTLSVQSAIAAVLMIAALAMLSAVTVLDLYVCSGMRDFLHDAREYLSAATGAWKRALELRADIEVKLMGFADGSAETPPRVSGAATEDAEICGENTAKPSADGAGRAG